MCKATNGHELNAKSTVERDNNGREREWMIRKNWMKFERSGDFQTPSHFVRVILKAVLAPICIRLNGNARHGHRLIQSNVLNKNDMYGVFRPWETMSKYIDQKCICWDDWKVDMAYVRCVCVFVCVYCVRLFEVIVCDAGDLMTLRVNAVYSIISVWLSFSILQMNHMDA